MNDSGIPNLGSSHWQSLVCHLYTSISTIVHSILRCSQSAFTENTSHFFAIRLYTQKFEEGMWLTPSGGNILYCIR